MNNKNKKIVVQNIPVSFISRNEDDYISLTDIARYKDRERSDYIVQNWLRTRSAIEFLGLWEKIHNPNFNSIEFDGFKNSAGSNSFSITPRRWIDAVRAVGLITKSGRYGGGTYAHKDIAFEFASWISPEFKLYLIKEFQRLKSDEDRRLALGWNVKRLLAKVNYKIHTDAIKEHIVSLIPPPLSREAARMIYADEADVLNVALFGMTAREWRSHNLNPKKEGKGDGESSKNSKDGEDMKGNIRDRATVEQLVVLSNMESMNAEYIRQGLPQSERLQRLNVTAIYQMKSLVGNTTLHKLATP